VDEYDLGDCMKKMMLLCLILLSFLDVYAQVDTAWVRRYNGSGNGPDLATGIAVDEVGNVYITGSSTDSIGGTEGATIKYNSAGAQQWVAHYNRLGDLADLSDAIAVDASGNVYVTGSSTGYYNGSDYLTIKYNSNGDTAWVRFYDAGVGRSEQAYAIAIDDQGNVYVTGEGIGDSTYHDYATVKYNSSGEEKWVTRYVSPAVDANDDAAAIAIDDAGNVYVTGKSDSTGTDEDYLTVKYDSSGEEKWVARYNGPGSTSDAAYGIAVDQEGNVYVTGYSAGDSTFQDYATIKYNSAGARQWVSRYTGPSKFSMDMAYAIAIDNAGNVYVTGTSGTSGVWGDYATIKYNTAGEEQWTAVYDSASSSDKANAIKVDNAGNVYVTGSSVSATNNDYATVKYNAAGQRQWAVRYDGPLHGLDDALALAVDSAGNVFVTGYSQGPEGNLDYLTIKYIAGTSGIEDAAPNISKRYQLYNNYPNPFNPTTTISFDLPVKSFVTLKVFDILGREVAAIISEQLPAGTHIRKWDAGNLPSGVYFYRIHAGAFTQTKKLVILR